MHPAAQVIADTLHRLNPQLSGWEVLAVRLAEVLDEEGLLWCEDELDFGRPMVDVATGGRL